jgi:3D (Asp-Asp-Asp) domain-containing protein
MERKRWATAVAALMMLGLCLPVAKAESGTPAPSNTSATATANATVGFPDLPASHWAAPAILKLKEAGLVQGDPSGLFRPDEPIKRGELAKLLLRVRRIDPGRDCRGIFRDVPCSAWYAPAVETAYRMAIMEGKGGGLFDPEGLVTRQEMTVAAVRAIGRRWEVVSRSGSIVRQRLSAISDAGEVAAWARPYVADALEQKVIQGDDGARVRPQEQATRAEVTVALGRILVGGDQVKTAQVDGRTIAYTESMEMVASAYSAGEPGVGTQTYTGLTVRLGTVAVDPRVIPLGRLLYVEGYGYAVAADIGGSVKGDRIDLYLPDLGAARAFGLQRRRVFLLP